MKRMAKVFVTTPASHTDLIVKAMGDAGAGVVGNYSYCAFITKGTGNFLPGENAQPFSGKVGEMSREPEDRIEMICEFGDIEKIVAAIKQVHPYESPTIDVFQILFYS